MKKKVTKKRTVSAVVALALIVATMASCTAKATPTPVPATPAPTVAASKAPSSAPTVAAASAPAPAASGDIVDGKFTKTRNITVQVFDRANTGGTPPDNNFYSNFIKDGVMKDHNVAVTFKPVPRWTEVEAMNNLLASGNAPDVCVTYSYPTIQTYASMGGVTDLSKYLADNKPLLTNLWGLLTDTNIYWDRDPENGSIWAIEARLFHPTRINTFVREDWLKKLNIPEPKTTQEFDAMLKAFKDNASTLLGADAAKMIPFSTSFDVGWRTDHLVSSFLPNTMTDKEFYMHNFDDRRLLYPGYKDGIKKLNEWYNLGYIWKDFPLYKAGDATEDNMIKAGYVGSFIHNWNYPYINGNDGIHANLQKLVGPDAAFIAVEPFKNSAGVYRKFVPGPVDRKLFLPVTNKEPVASLLYLDWISKLENRMFLQIGEEGVTHQKQPDGSVKTIAASGEKVMNSGNNLDYTTTINGLDLGDKAKTIKSMSLGYGGVDSRFIDKAYSITFHDAIFGKNINVGKIAAEDGMSTTLKEKRDIFLNQAVVAKPEEFSATFDAGMKDYLSSGGQAIIDERKKAFEKFYGTKTSVD